MKRLDSSTPLDLFDFRYGKNGTILCREGAISSEATIIESNDDGDIQKELWRYCVDVSSEYYAELNEKINKVANKSLRKLAKDNPGLLIFPDKPENLEEDIQKDCILETEKFGDKIRVSTYNLIGFIGCDDLKINIHSRVEEDTIKDGKKITDFFLIYMLEKICRLNLLDLPSPSRDDINIFDLLPYLFPQYLKRALAQGMFKEYVRRQNNDANIKGTIDVSRHIRSNIPFLGKVAYNTREFSFDNRITQLIRHTIEHLRKFSLIGERIINSPDVIDMVRQIVDATPTYSAMDRQKVIMDNLRPFAHPYYYEYAPLQKLCLAILRHDQLSYGDSTQEVHGVIFDIAALWEEYLAVVLQDKGIVHPNNREHTDTQYLFEGKSGAYSRYPDFFKQDKTCVMDAKYKRIADNDNHIERNDIHQLITYMYMMQAGKGVIISPALDCGGYKEIGTLNGYGGKVGLYYFCIPSSETDYHEFCKRMKAEESSLQEYTLEL